MRKFPDIPGNPRPLVVGTVDPELDTLLFAIGENRTLLGRADVQDLHDYLTEQLRKD